MLIMLMSGKEKTEAVSSRATVEDIGGVRLKQETGIRRWQAIVSGWKEVCLSALRWLSELLCGEKIVVTGESWYGDSQSVKERYLYLRPDEDGVLVCRMPDGLDQHIFLTKDKMTIGNSLEADKILNAPGMAVFQAVFTRCWRDSDGKYHYFVTSGNDKTTIEIDGRPLSELKESDPPGDPGHELYPGNVIVLSGFSITFLRRVLSSNISLADAVTETSPHLYQAKNAPVSIGLINSGGE